MKKTKKEDYQLLTAREVAKLLHVSKAQAYRLIQQGRLKSIRFGRTVRVKPEDLEAFIQRNTHSSWPLD
jgi:excisionase family DNA binding protein